MAEELKRKGGRNELKHLEELFGVLALQGGSGLSLTLHEGWREKKWKEKGKGTEEQKTPPLEGVGTRWWVRHSATS